MQPRLVKLLGVSLLSAIFITAPSLAAPLRVAYSGAGVATEIDLNDDGVTAILAQARGKGSIGQVSVHALFDAVPAPNTSCGAGEIQNDLVAATNILQNKKGHQLFLLLVDGVLCADPTFTSFTLTLEEEIVGGTGKFAGASGESTTTCAGLFLAVDFVPAGGRAAHAAFSCDLQGDLD